MAMTTATTEPRSAFQGAGPLAAELASAGALAGLLGGLFLGLWMMIGSAVAGDGFWMPMKLIAGVFWGVDVLLMHGTAVAAGIVIHLVVSMFLGIVFALLVRRELPYGSAFVSAALYGIAVWLFMTYVILFLDPVMRERLLLSSGNWFWVHLLFGFGLSFTPALRRAWTLRRSNAR
ncbi:MAG: hypothetical protein ACYCWW_21260 [Deltaproteobacteria bacterium]